MKKIGFYEVRTETDSTAPGRTYDRFTVVACGFEDAVKKAKTSGNILKGERIQDIALKAEAAA